jgi:cytidyltransferase-like protein
MLVETDYFMTATWESLRHNKKVIMVSGGFDPMHGGHLQYIIDAAKLKGPDGILVAVVNGDGFLHRKKQYRFMVEYERARIVDNQKGVDYTLIWDDDTQHVDGALRLIRPHIFAKGGDRSSNHVMPHDELSACNSLKIQLEYGVGGLRKINSSSELVENFEKLKKAP